MKKINVERRGKKKDQTTTHYLSPNRKGDLWTWNSTEWGVCTPCVIRCFPALSSHWIYISENKKAKSLQYDPRNHRTTNRTGTSCLEFRISFEGQVHTMCYRIFSAMLVITLCELPWKTESKKSRIDGISPDRESNGASCTEIPPEFILYLVGQVKTMCHRVFSSSLSRPPYMRKNEQDCCKNGKTVFSGYHQAITQPRIERGPPADILTRHMHCQHTYTDRCTCAVGWLKTSAV